MQFIYPAFLFALAALAIPIIIHLFNFRRFKKLYFTNVRFLKEIKQDTRSKSKVKHLLVLISRILALGFLILAFAQPYIPSGTEIKKSASRNISIFVDNSFSMNSRGSNGILLDDAKRKAREIALSYKASDRFQLLTNEFEGRHQRLLTRDEFLQELDRVQSGSASRNVSEIMSRQADLLAGKTGDEASASAFIISDFQKSISDFDNSISDTLIQFRLVPLEAITEQNISIDTCFLETPYVLLNAPAELIVRIRNNGDKNAENIPLKLLINDQQRALASVNIPAKSSTDTRLSFTVNRHGWQASRLSISDYPVSFDDNYYFSFNVLEKINILSIGSPKERDYLNILFRSDPYFDYSSVTSGQVNYSSFDSKHFIVLNEVDNISTGLEHELQRYVENGGSCLIIPSESADLKNYSSLYQALGCNPVSGKAENPEKVSAIEFRHPVFSDVFDRGKNRNENIDLPIAHKYFQFSRGMKSREEALMRLSNGNTFLAVTESGKGKTYTLSVPLKDEWSNFHRHAIFVPFVLKAALLSTNSVSAPSIIGRDNEFTVNRDSIRGSETILHLINPELGFDIIPESRALSNKLIVAVHDQVKQAGNYSLTSGDAILTLHSFNYDRRESDLSYLSPEELRRLADKSNINQLTVINTTNADLSASIAELDEGKRLWKYFILLCLIFLAVEILLIRYYQPAKNIQAARP